VWATQKLCPTQEKESVTRKRDKKGRKGMKNRKNTNPPLIMDSYLIQTGGIFKVRTGSFETNRQIYHIVGP